MNIINKFLERTKEKIFIKNNKLSQGLPYLFQEIYHPHNPRNNRIKIGDLIAKKYGCEQFLVSKSINEYLKRVGEKIIKTFKAEIENDGYNPDEMVKQKRYPLTYEWLWQCKFPREAWALCQECAYPIQPSGEVSRDFKQPCNPNHVKVDENWYFRANFGRSGYLYLINRGTSGKKYLFSPSAYFAKIPATELTPNTSFCLPWDDNHYPLSFGNVGEEYFLAIVTAKPLNLSWIKKGVTDLELELDEVKLGELFALMIKDSNLEIFDRKIKIVE